MKRGKKYPVVDRRGVSNTQIYVAITDFTTGEFRKLTTFTDSDGHFRFDIATSYHWYKKYRYFMKAIHVYIPNELNEIKFIFINPWDNSLNLGIPNMFPYHVPSNCLDKTDMETQIFQTLLEEKDSAKIKKLIKDDEKYREVVKKLFCYDTTLQTIEDRNLKQYPVFPRRRTAAVLKLDKLLDLSDLFVQYKTGLNQQRYMQHFLNERAEFVEETYKEIDFILYISDTIETRPRPVTFSYINFPKEYVSIDLKETNPLQRYLKYHIPIDLNIKVVRRDIGEHDERPIKDGIYVL